MWTSHKAYDDCLQQGSCDIVVSYYISNCLFHIILIVIMPTDGATEKKLLSTVKRT